MENATIVAENAMTQYQKHEEGLSIQGETVNKLTASNRGTTVNPTQTPLAVRRSVTVYALCPSHRSCDPPLSRYRSPFNLHACLIRPFTLCPEQLPSSSILSAGLLSQRCSACGLLIEQ
ncbi:hypothetical protein AcW1_000898 [Taiwanofungus camphoratus]|nr:hypothetical protein AcW1_000898 [Antrodia cinnamomea]